MDLKAFSGKINTLAQEGRIGVSERIGLFDQGKELGLARGAIDKMIDAALLAVKQNKNVERDAPREPFASIPTPVPPVAETATIEPIAMEPEPPRNIIIEEVKEDVSDLEAEANDLLDSLNEMELDSAGFESEVNSAQESIDEIFEEAKEEINEAENTIELEAAENSNESIKESLESILAEIKKESSESQSISFEDAISQQEIEIDEAVEDENWVPAYEPEPDESESFPEPTQGEHGEVALAEGVIIMIAGILSIATCMTIVGIFAAVAGLFLHRTATKKINEQKSGYYKAQHLNLLKIGIVLAWIGGIISVLIRFIPRFL
jgi:hypothetical protein